MKTVDWEYIPLTFLVMVQLVHKYINFHCIFYIFQVKNQNIIFATQIILHFYSRFNCSNTIIVKNDKENENSSYDDET